MAFSDFPKLEAVIGSGYGDEGKGMFTDFLSSFETRVVRFNGGAQAAHTVETPYGTRHIFHHIGSGTLNGAYTHLSKYFVINPILALKEFEELRAKGIFPDITVDPNAPVTTPIDMMLNQALEHGRGDKRHGSCGVGFGETIERTENGPKILVKDLYKLNTKTLEDIQYDWYFHRREQLDVELPPMFFSPKILKKFYSECLEFLGEVELMSDSQIWEDVNKIIFEGAQGLGLDQDLGHFPNVTRSHTGLLNVAKLMEEAKLKEPLSTYYLTRSYDTRHGAGPLDREGELKWGPLRDDTNVTNEWQGEMRFAPLNIREKRDWVERDLERVKDSIEVDPSLVITCVDQVPVGVDFDPDAIASEFDLRLAATSHGPNRKATIMY